MIEEATSFYQTNQFREENSLSRILLYTDYDHRKILSSSTNGASIKRRPHGAVLPVSTLSIGLRLAVLPVTPQYTYCSIFPLFYVRLMIWLHHHRADESWLYFHVVRTLSNVKIETPKKSNSNQSLYFSVVCFLWIFSFSNFLRRKTRILRFCLPDRASTGQRNRNYKKTQKQYSRIFSFFGFHRDLSRHNLGTNFHSTKNW